MCTFSNIIWNHWRFPISFIWKFSCSPAPESRGYKLARGLGYYNYHGPDESATWDDARRLCEEEYPNSHLVILNSEDEAQWVATMIKAHYNLSTGTGYYAWSGFHRLTGDEFVTIFCKCCYLFATIMLHISSFKIFIG